MKQWPSGLVGQQIALYLHPDVAPVACLFARTVVETGQFRHILRVTHEALVDGMHGVFKGERPLELPGFHLKQAEPLPLGVGIHYARTAAERGRIAVYLHLNLVFNVVKQPSAQGKARHAHVKRVAPVAALERCLILSYDIAAQFGRCRCAALASCTTVASHCNRRCRHGSRKAYRSQARHHASLLSSSTTFSTWGVWGNISTGCTATTL